MPKSHEISVVKTAATSNTLKLIANGAVAGSIVAVGAGHEVRDKSEKVIGTYDDADTALSAFKSWLDLENLDAEL